MKHFAVAAACIFTLAGTLACPASKDEELQAAFAPEDDVEGLIIKEIEHAQKQVLMQAYLLTNRKIAGALIRARHRGIDVRVLGDAERQLKVDGSLLSDLSASGIPVWVETKYQNAHDKVILIDPELPNGTVITGSFNFTWTAQHLNAENILVVRGNSCLSSRFLMNWQRRQKEASLYAK